MYFCPNTPGLTVVPHFPAGGRTAWSTTIPGSSLFRVCLQTTGLRTWGSALPWQRGHPSQQHRVKSTPLDCSPSQLLSRLRIKPPYSDSLVLLLIWRQMVFMESLQNGSVILFRSHNSPVNSALLSFLFTGEAPRTV